MFDAEAMKLAGLAPVSPFQQVVKKIRRFCYDWVARPIAYCKFFLLLAVILPLCGIVHKRWSQRLFCLVQGRLFYDEF